MISTSPTAKVTLPGQSIGPRRGVPISCSFRYAQTVPNRPTGTEIRNTSRQLDRRQQAAEHEPDEHPR